LARALSVAAPTLTKYVDKLAVNAYVFRLADPGDRRKVLVHASSRGTSVHQELLGTIAATEAEVLGMFAARDRQALERMLNHYGKQAEDFTSQ
jgi:DNA-binding MarR family transcriptional regulator